MLLNCADSRELSATKNDFLLNKHLHLPVISLRRGCDDCPSPVTVPSPLPSSNLFESIWINFNISYFSQLDSSGSTLSTTYLPLLSESKLKQLFIIIYKQVWSAIMRVRLLNNIDIFTVNCFALTSFKFLIKNALESRIGSEVI